MTVYRSHDRMHVSFNTLKTNIITTLTLLHHNLNIQLIKTMFKFFFSYPLAAAGVPLGVRVSPVENR